MSSPLPSPIRFRFHSVRFARWIWRLMWHRRTVWMFAGLVLLTTLYWQWENWRA